MQLTRRQFGLTAAATVGSTLTRSFWAREAYSSSCDRYLCFAVIAVAGHSLNEGLVD
jgi:hypothetical protein